jgi:hypothetical protein
MIVATSKTEKTLYKLRQQFIKCNLFGCEHPVFNYTYYATSEEKLQELLMFLQKTFAFFSKKQMRRA